jgi:hypothetical protein
VPAGSYWGAGGRSAGDPRQRIIAVFDWLQAWFSEPGFRGCAWINGYGGDAAQVRVAYCAASALRYGLWGAWLAGVLARARTATPPSPLSSPALSVPS